ncbi:MAG: cytosolic Fe-S cluster assembly factor cfd1 [Icmadophila ericetorum]|nr:cytosolic Fe-S cluster assembly factor cfd1 [Icmadophila ericetorum]
MSLDNVKKIVLVLSGKGGVGKSSVTTQLALSLTLAGHTVGILDVDLTGPSIPRLLGIESAKVKQAPGGWLPVEVHSSQYLQPISTENGSSTSMMSIATNGTTSNGDVLDGEPATKTHPISEDFSTQQLQATTQIGALYAMSLAFLLTSRSSAIVWRGPKKTAMVRQFLSSVLWPPLDYLLIDTPPGTSDEHISLVESLIESHNAEMQDNPRGEARLAGAVIVTTPQAVAISDVRKEINFCRKVGVGVLGVVENMSGYVCECCGVATNLFSKGGGEVMANEFGVKFLGSVPLDSQWGILVEEGRRPRYGGVIKQSDADDEADYEMDEESDEAKEDIGDGIRDQDEEAPKRGREEGLLVDKYRSCSLYPVFAGISKQVSDNVEQDGTVIAAGVPPGSTVAM